MPTDPHIYILLMEGMIFFLLGICLLLFKTPANSSYTKYRQSKATFAAIYILFAIELVAQWFQRIYFSHNALLSAAIYLTVFYASGVLMAEAHALLYSTSSAIARYHNQLIIKASLYFAWVWGSFLFNYHTQLIMITIASGLLFLQMCYLVLVTIKRTYPHAKAKILAYYSSPIKAFLQVVPTLLTIIFGISSPFVLFCPRWVSQLQTALGLIVFVYLFVWIINFVFYSPQVSYAIKIAEETSDCPQNANQKNNKLSQSLCCVIDAKVQRWQGNGGYRTAGLTIDQAAHDIGTNRSYLSMYIHQVCNKNFYEWIRDLRIQEAKQLLAERTLTIENIASTLGFGSSSNFSHTFKQITGKSPLAWRQNHQ